MTTVQNYPVYQLPALYINGLALSNDATTPNTKLDIAAGQCRDSNDIIDMVVGGANLEGTNLAAPLILDATTNGANGLDTGSLAASTFYAIYIIGDSRYYKPVASIATLASNSVPLLPLGYDSYRRIGFALTDGSSHFLKFYQTGTSGNRLYTWDNNIQVLAAGTATSLTAINLSSAVPPINNSQVTLEVAYTPATAGDGVLFAPGGSTATLLPALNSVVAAVAQKAQLNVIETLVAGVPTIQYKNSAASGSTLALVSSFTDSL